MDTLELKTNLHRLIDQINDDLVLQAHLTLLSREISNQPTDFWDNLSAEQQASIDRGVTDLEAGRKRPFAAILKKLAE